MIYFASPNKLALFLSCSALVLSGCTTLPSSKAHLSASYSTAANMQPSLTAFQQGDMPKARNGFANEVARNPYDPNRQTLLAMTYHQEARGATDTLDLALAGYDLALKSGQDTFWAAALAGKAAFDRGQYQKAQNYFARAALIRPDDPRAYVALANAAYMSGDPQLAALASERAITLSEDIETTQAALRIGTLANAANANEQRAWALYGRFREAAPDQAQTVFVRVNELVRTQDADPKIGSSFSEQAANIVTPDQVSVDVAIILSQTLQKDAIGINLLDGLQGQYGRQDQTTNIDDTVSRTITDSISIPQLTYNLNIFNRFGQYYQVVARPMLTAYRGESSDFFVGRTTKVAVGGVNFAQLENIDIGTQIKVTPLEITADGTKLRIEVTRSFLSGESAGNFAETLNTFRQTVSTTVEVKFGTTLILSGLSESVRDATGSKTPLLGDTPVVGSMFNKRITTNRRDSVLILVTPSPSQAFASPTWSRPADVERLIELWGTVIAPGSDLGAITTGLSHARLFTRAKRSDGRLSWPDLTRDQSEIFKDLVLP